MITSRWEGGNEFLDPNLYKDANTYFINMDPDPVPTKNCQKNVEIY